LEVELISSSFSTVLAAIFAIAPAFDYAYPIYSSMLFAKPSTRYHAGSMKQLNTNTERRKQMIFMRYKTLVICEKYYEMIHNGV